MSSCCAGSSCEVANGDQVCPNCGQKAATVDPITLKALLTAQGLRRGVPPNPRFCASANCPVVYFGGSVIFTEADLVVPVHAKHPAHDDVPVCYCFGHTPASIRDEITRSGKSGAFATITADVKAGHCACEVRNPKGDCCLGDVLKTERRLMSELALVVG